MALQYKNIKNNLKTMISPLLTRSQVFAGYKTLGTKLILKLANVFKTHLTRNLQTRSKQRICLNCNQNKIDFVLKVGRLMLVHIPNQKGVILTKKQSVWKSWDWTWNAIPKSDNEQRKAELEKTAKGLDERLEAEANRLKVS